MVSQASAPAFTIKRMPTLFPLTRYHDHYSKSLDRLISHFNAAVSAISAIDHKEFPLPDDSRSTGNTPLGAFRNGTKYFSPY